MSIFVVLRWDRLSTGSGDSSVIHHFHVKMEKKANSVFQAVLSATQKIPIPA